ncbi:MAG: glutaredoxin family protein [Burkholderiales bacterium]|nr:glutaredoxin family protein [Burkholderiales bacterium]
MKNSALATIAAGLMCAVAAASALAQYKYVGPDGRVTYSDTPPPTSAKPLGKPATSAPAPAPAGGSSTTGAQSLPFALQGPTKTYPVVIYTGADCEACNQGRRLLATRGVPFAEKTVRTQEDLNAFKAATGSSQIPVLMVGGSKSVGFDESAWNIALTGAGYPTNNQLPPNYKNPPPAAAAPTAKPVAVAPSPKPQAEAPQGAPGADAGQSATPPTAPPPAPTSKPPTWFKGF